MEFFIEHGKWAFSNPVGFVSFALLFIGLGWGAARILYHERLELLKELAGRNKAKPAVDSMPPKISYAAQGRHGRNVLASTVHDARIGEPMSFQAMIPEGSRLHIALRGPAPTTLSDARGAWGMNPFGVVNWTKSNYQETTSEAIQHFNAEPGPADLEFAFNRAGEVLIESFENESKVPTWSKRIHVS